MIYMGDIVTIDCNVSQNDAWRGGDPEGVRLSGLSTKSQFWKLVGNTSGTGDGVVNKCAGFTDTSPWLHK